jgi:peptide/nickel transport system permease protein
MLGPNATPDTLAALRDELGVTNPLYEQILIYLSNVAHGNLGKSWQTAANVTDDLLERFPATLESCDSQPARRLPRSKKRIGK